MDATNHRGDEPPALHIRSDRCVLVNGQWFVVTREEIEVGPFESREDAEAASARISTLLAGITDPVVAAEFIREEFNIPQG